MDDDSISPFHTCTGPRKLRTNITPVPWCDEQEDAAENKDPKAPPSIKKDEDVLQDDDDEEVIIVDDNDEEVVIQDDVLFASPPPPLPTSKKCLVPYSSRRGRPSTRIIEMLRPKLRELATKRELEDKDGFYSLAWQYDDSVLQSKATNPTYNVKIICARIQKLYADLSSAFILSGVYIGKSSKLRMGERFGLHRNKTKDKINACVAMIAVATFAECDVPDAFLLFEENGEDLALKYEKLVLKNICDNIPLYSDTMDAGGGGKVGLGVSYGIVYALVVLGSK